MTDEDRDYHVFVFDFSLPHSDITLGRALIRRNKPLAICLVEVITWVNGKRLLVRSRLDLDKEMFIDPIYDADGVVDDEATEKLRLQRYAVTEIVLRMYSATARPN